jgi:hypothetical protein
MVRALEIKRWPSALAATLGAFLSHALPFRGLFLGLFRLLVVDRLQRPLDDCQI